MEKRKNNEQYAQLNSNQAPNIIQALESHPYNYLTCLNNVYNYYDQNYTLNHSERIAKFDINLKPFKKMNIPKVFYQNFIIQKQNLSSNHDVNDQVLEEPDKKLWRQHQQLKKKYLIKRKKIYQPIKITEQKGQYQKNWLKDRKNHFLKKFIKSGNILDTNRLQLQKQVVSKLKKLASGGYSLKKKSPLKIQKMQRRKTQRQKSMINNIRINNSRDKALKINNNQLNDLNLELKQILGNRDNQSQKLRRDLKQVVEGRHLKEISFFDMKDLDISISCNNIKKIRDFFNYVKKLQANI